MRGISFVPMLLFTLFVCLLCWGVKYYDTPAELQLSRPATPLWEMIFDLLQGKLAAYIVGLFLICIMAFMLQRANYHMILLRRKTWLPLLLFLFLNSTTYGYIPLRPVSIAFIFLLLSLIELFRGYQNGLSSAQAYKALMYLSIGGFFWTHLLWFILAFWYGMYHFRLLNSRNFVASLLGVFTTYWIMLGWCVWQRDFSLFTVIYQNLIAITPFFRKEFLHVQLWISPLASLLMLLALTGYVRTHELDDGIRVRQFMAFLLALGRYLIVLLFFYHSENVNFLCIFYIPVSLLIAHLFFNASGRRASLYYSMLVVYQGALLAIHYSQQ